MIMNIARWVLTHLLNADSGMLSGYGLGPGGVGPGFGGTGFGGIGSQAPSLWEVSNEDYATPS